MPEYAIPAEAHTDDHIVKVEFDAAPWFAQASEEAILALSDCDWGGDEAADSVAEWSVRTTPELQRVFDHYNPDEDVSGFECHVDEEAAMAWLRANRPDVAELLDRLNGYAE